MHLSSSANRSTSSVCCRSVRSTAALFHLPLGGAVCRVACGDADGEEQGCVSAQVSGIHHVDPNEVRSALTARFAYLAAVIVIRFLILVTLTFRSVIRPHSSAVA